MPGEVTIGIVTAVTIEQAAVRKVVNGPRDQHGYCLGSIPSADRATPHHVAVRQQTRDGTRDAAAAVTDLVLAFPSVRFVLMCGIAAGAPQAGVRLGDVVSATAGIVDYGHLTVTDDGGALRRAPGDVSAAFVDADNRLAQDEVAGRRPWLTTLAGLEQDNAAFRRPPPPGTPVVHRGALGSADILLRNAALRDSVAGRHRVIAFEMEAAGVATAARRHEREYFVVKGISDLGDRHKDDRWHGYAAAGAAAYLHALLGTLAPAGSTSKPARRGSIAAVTRIVEALLGSRSVRDEHDRQRLIDALPTHIGSRVPYSPSARTHVISIVRTCQEYPDGRDALLDSLSLLIGTDHPELDDLAEVIRENWSQA
jgi:nucleoside phosphorylase